MSAFVWSRWLWRLGWKVLSLLAISVAAWAANQAPIVNITSPAPNTREYAPAAITLKATAVDPDGSVTKLEFLNGTTVLGIGAPTGNGNYELARTFAAGTYSITARATDNLNKAATSTAVPLQVVAITTVISQPTAGAVVPCCSVGVSGSYTGLNTTSIIVSGGAGHSTVASLFGNAFSANVALRPGQNTIEVQVARRDGTAEVAKLNVTAIEPPVVVLTGPASCSIYSIGSSETFTADAASLAGSITLVEFFDNGVAFASSSTPPYTATRVFSTPGDRTITVRATDNQGLTNWTSGFAVTVRSAPPVVSLTSPTNGQTFRPGGTINLRATASDPDGTVSLVEFFANGSFVGGSGVAPYGHAWTGYATGTYRLKAVATDNGGGKGTSPEIDITVAANANPTVALTSPASGATFLAPASVNLAATAADADGSIAKVQFLNGTTVIGEATSSPYQATWSNVAAGNYTISAKAIDNEGGSTNSPGISVTVTAPPPNQSPSVALTSPTNNAAYSAPVDITLSATAGDADGSIAKVEFFDGDSLLATVGAPPFTHTWVNPSLGSHLVVAKATDNLGATSTASANITVNGSVVTISQPANGASFEAPASYQIVASVSTTTGTFRKVEFLDGEAVKGVSHDFDLASATLPFNYENVSAGIHVHRVRALHSSGEWLVSAPVNVDVNVPPRISLASPVPNDHFIAPAVISIQAKPSGFTSGIAYVKFYNGDSLLHTAIAPPYVYLWNNVGQGNYAVRAVATDSTGREVSSPQHLIQVTPVPALQLTAGQDGSTVPDIVTAISGSINAPANSSVLVNGRPAVLEANGRWYMEEVLLQAGANSIAVTLKTPGAADTTQTITVTSSAMQPLGLQVSPAEGVGRLVVLAAIEARVPTAIGRVEFDADSDGTNEAVIAQPQNGAYMAQFLYPGPGVYTLTARVYEPGGQLIFTSTRSIHVVSAELMGRRLNGVYSLMLGRLQAGNPTGALAAIEEEVRPYYEEMFTALGDQLPTFASQLGTVEFRLASDRIAQLVVSRTTHGQSFSYLIQLVRDNNGLWRISSM